MFRSESLCLIWGYCGVASSLGFRNHHQRRADHAPVQGVTLLQHGDDRVWLAFGFDLADGLMLVRVELLAERVDLGQIGFLESGPIGARSVRRRNLMFSALWFSLARAASRLSFTASSSPAKLLDGVLAGLGNVFLGAAPDVFGLGLGAQPGIVVLGCLEFGGLEQVVKAGHHFRRVARKSVLAARRFARRLLRRAMLRVFGVSVLSCMGRAPQETRRR
jgi:hypothetical protein